MIMIRGGQAQKMGGKPPPPVPPRPSKSVVQEALAKSRSHLREATKSPTRRAPPPPIGEVAKSKSSYSVNVGLKKPAILERSISEETKNNSRPVVYQSSNLKNSDNRVQITRKEGDRVQITRRDGDVNIVNRVDSFRGNVQVVRSNSLKKPEDGRSSKRGSLCQEKILEIKDGGGKAVTNCSYNGEKSKSNSSTLEKSCDSSGQDTYESSSSHSSLDKKNWDKMLNDRNHVNTLIDEMFASVLEVQVADEKPSDDDCRNTPGKKLRAQNSFKKKNGLPPDTTQIIVNGASDTSCKNLGNATAENAVKSRDSGFKDADVKRVDLVRSKDVPVEENVVPKTVIVIKNESVADLSRENHSQKESSISVGSGSDSEERAKQQVKFKDQLNHELLINELQCMKKDQEKILKRQRKPSMNIYEDSAVPRGEKVSGGSLNASGEGELLRSSCYITIADPGEGAEVNLDYERISKMSSLHGLPPLPKSLSGFSLPDHRHPPHPSPGQQPPNPPTPARTSSMRTDARPPYVPPRAGVGGAVDHAAGRKPATGLDAQLAVLRREMYSLRQLDLSLLSQLWSLNESIQDFRQILQDQDDDILLGGRAGLSPPSPSLAASSTDDDDEFYMSASSLNFSRPPPPPPVAARRASGSSNASSLG